MVITLKQYKGTNFGKQIYELIRIVKEINAHSLDREVVFDFGQITFVHPLFILTLCGLISYLENHRYTVSCIHTNNYYLKAIHFPEGFKPDQTINWEDV